MSDAPFIAASNGDLLDRRELQQRSVAELEADLVAAVKQGQRVAAMLALPNPHGVRLLAVVADDVHNELHLAMSSTVAETYPSMTPKCPQVHLFEREIAEQYGVRPEGHPWLKPVRFTRPVRPGREVFPAADVGVTDYYRVEGDEVHEVAVGPVHAGVIEPGHFRFQCHGEEVFHLEISLGYQHRGVEPSLVGGPTKRTIHTFETLAGDTTIGHATAYCEALEALARCQVPPRALVLRGIALELERLANHTGDLGALANDVAYLPTASFCGRLRGDFLNMSAVLCGSRFGRGMVRPGGVGFDVDAARVDDLRKRLDAAEKDVRTAANLLWDTSSVMARFSGTGTVDADTCREMGIVGPAARASGVNRDVRADHPSGIFRMTHVPVATWHTGDVFARAFVRWMEIQNSIVFIREQLASLPGGRIMGKMGAPAPESLVVSMVEGWRGEICHVAMTGADGKFARYKVVDPSFHNWTALSRALRNQQISDFPLCNKSFNLSYCGYDL
jgi:Ni,Fe-hydrogenase III large subunit